MTSEVEMTVSPAKKTRGRPRAITTESPQQRIDRLQEELRHAQEAKRLAEQHRDQIIGAIVIRHACVDEGFRRQLAALLHNAVTGRGDVRAKDNRAAVSALLDELESGLSKPPSS